MTAAANKPKKPTHPWRAFNPGWLKDKGTPLPKDRLVPR